MKSINSYNDILNEGMVIPSFKDHSDIIECIEQFLKVQDNLFVVKVKENDFVLEYNLDGYAYKVKGYIENAKVRIKCINRYNGDDNLEYSFDSDEFEIYLDTRDVYEKFINKIVKLLKPV